MLMSQLRDLVLDPRPLDRLLAAARPGFAAILERALENRELDSNHGLELLAAEGPDLAALIRTADSIRAADVGPEITYVVNRKIGRAHV